ncbi:hypothetical protein BGX27_007183 [Mortierella sp. AM989]|nr:hypothetical protein BGX27_007183 [Mortierella sp. AM989]
MQQQQQQQQQQLYQQQQLRLDQLQRQQQQPQFNPAVIVQSQQLPLNNIPSPQTLAYSQQQSFTAHSPNNNNNNNSNSIASAQTLVSHYNSSNLYNDNKSTNWDTTALLGNQGNSEDPMALSIAQDGSFVAVVPRWESYDLNTLSSNQLVGRTVIKPADASLPRTVPEFTQQQQQQGHQTHASMIMRQPQHQYISQGQSPLIQENSDLQKSAQHPYQQQHQQSDILFTNDYLFDAPSPVPTMSSLDIAVPVVPVQQQQQQFHNSPSPIHIPEYIQQSCSPDMPIKHSPVDTHPVWAPWNDGVVHPDDQVAYDTPASFDESPSDGDFSGPKHLKVFTSSKKDDDGEFRKGQQFYLNVHLNEADRERYRYIRIPTENLVLPCRADSTGRIGLNASGKRSAEAMSAPTSAQEEDVLSLKLTTFLEPEHRSVLPCGRCKDKTTEILRFHPGVNGKPMIDENGMVILRNGQVKLIASAWCASTSHHRGPGTKFSFEIELTSMGHPNHAGPLLVYQGHSEEVEIYASHGRDKGSRSMKNTEKLAKSQSPPLHESGSAGGPPSPAKTSSPPSSPSASDAAHHYDMSPLKKRREEPPMTPPLLDAELPPVIKCLEPRRGPICKENHVIILGQNFTRGMTPMFGHEYGKVIEISPSYIECTTPRYPKAESVRLFIYHNNNFIPSDKTYEFTNEQAQSELEQMLRNMIQSDGEAGDASSYFNMLGRIANLPSSTDISGQSQSNGSTMLHNSVLLGYQAGVELLIEEGIELDIEDDSGMTALDYAIHTNNVEISSALLNAGSIVSYERLDKLPLRPTSAMVNLLKDLCGIDLPTSTNSGLQDQVPDLVDLVEEAEAFGNYNVPTVDAAIPETIVEEAEPEDEKEQATLTSEKRSISGTTVSQLTSTSTPMKAAPQARAAPTRSSRPMSINTMSTQSTGMASLAPTMSTMAPSATSSMQSRSSNSITGMRSGPVHGSRAGLENIWQCAKKGNLALVKYHLEKDPSLINTPWKFDGRSVLSSACASSQPQDLVEYLVQHKAQVNYTDSFHKRTPLHVLCEEGGLPQDDWRIMVSQAEQEANEQDVLAAMRFLLDNGAPVDAKNFWKETPLMKLFTGRDCPLMVQELYSRGADTRLRSSKDAYPHGTALCYAAYFGRIKSLKWMIENDLLLNDEASIKEAIRWAKSSKGESSYGNSSHHQQASPAQSANAVRRKEERKAEAIKLLEGFLGESGSAKRKTLAKAIVTQQADGWWMRMSGIVEDKVPGAHEDSDSMSFSSSSDLKMPKEMKPLWDIVQPLSAGLASSSDQSSGSSGRKWNPLKGLLKG